MRKTKEEGDSDETVRTGILQGISRCISCGIAVHALQRTENLHSIVQIPDVLQERNISKVLLVTDESIRGLGLTKHLEEELRRRSIFCAVYDKVVANPTIQNIEQARAVYLKSGAQAMIAFGGGSVMDCAKVTGARIVKPRKPVYKMKGLLRICKPLPLLIAVPTTAGTGSETTLAAVITDSGTKHKYPHQ